MSWLFLAGVSLDGIGAMLIAWPILRPGSAAREASRPRWNGDHWASIRREREVRLVQWGALFLGGGFGLQAAGYVVRLGNSWGLALLVLVLIVSVGMWVGTRAAARGLPKHVWYPQLQPDDAIADGLIIYGVGTIGDLQDVVRRYLRDAKAIDVRPVSGASEAFINSGIWTVHCPECHEPTLATTPEWRQAICTSCGASFEVAYPESSHRREIEQELVRFGDRAERRWVSDSAPPAVG